MTPRYRIMQFPWIVVIIFSAISVHSLLYNRKGPLEFNMARSLAGPLERSAEDGQMANLMGNACFESSTPVPSGCDSLRYQKLLSTAEARDQTSFEAALNSALPNMPMMHVPPLGEMHVDIGAKANSIMAQFDAIEVGAYPKGSNETSKSDTKVQHVFSLRPAVRPPEFEMTLGRSGVMGGGELVASVSPASSIRPLPRPNTLMVSVAGSLQPQQAVQTDMVEAAVSEALVLFPQSENEAVPSQEAQQPIRTQDSTRERIGTILGLFETNTRRWALVRTGSGRIIILEPGDTVGSAFVSSISKGSMQISSEDSLSAYSLGDDL